MNKLVFVCQKTENSSAQKFSEYFRGRCSFEKCFKKTKTNTKTKQKNESVLYSSANCSELSHNNFCENVRVGHVNPNTKVTLEHIYYSGFLWNARV